MADEDQTVEEEPSESDDEYGTNQYGGDSGDADAVEQTERMREDGDEDGDDGESA